jgi:hypothetical protein
VAPSKIPDNPVIGGSLRPRTIFSSMGRLSSNDELSTGARSGVVGQLHVADKQGNLLDVREDLLGLNGSPLAPRPFSFPIYAPLQTWTSLNIWHHNWGNF